MTIDTIFEMNDIHKNVIFQFGFKTLIIQKPFGGF